MKRIVFVITVVLVSLLATMALADTKIYPGSMSVRWNSAQPVPYLSYSSAGNPSSTATLNVDAPVISNGLKVLSAWVKVLDRHYSKDICCTLYNVYQSGTTWYGWTSPRKCSAGSNPSPQIMYFPSVANNSAAHSYFGCSIPPTYSGARSSIISYKVTN